MEHCCESMKYMVEEEISIIFIPEYREYGVPIRDGGSSYLVILYCPWCGTKLPESLHEEYFDILDKMGIDYACLPEELQEKLPENMRSEKWWQEREKK